MREGEEGAGGGEEAVNGLLGNAVVLEVYETRGLECGDDVIGTLLLFGGGAVEEEREVDELGEGVLANITNGNLPGGEVGATGMYGNRQPLFLNCSLSLRHDICRLFVRT